MLRIALFLFLPFSFCQAMLCPDWLVFAGHPRAAPHSGVERESENHVLFYSVDAVKKMVLLRSKALTRPGYEVAALGITRTFGRRTEVLRILAPEEAERVPPNPALFVPPLSDHENSGPPEFYGFDETYFQFAKEVARELGGELNYLVRWRVGFGAPPEPPDLWVTLGVTNLKECERLGIEWAEVRSVSPRGLAEEPLAAVYKISEVKSLASRLERGEENASRIARENNLYPQALLNAYGK